MQRLVMGLLSLTLLSCMTMADDLAKLDLDDASAIGTTIETDKSVKTQGEASVKITTQWPTTVCLGQVDAPDVENAKLIYTAQLKSRLDGSAWLEMWVNVNGSEYFSKGVDNPVKGTTDWSARHIPFMFQKGQSPDKVTLNVVINGKGTVWVDDIVLSKTKPAAADKNPN